MQLLAHEGHECLPTPAPFFTKTTSNPSYQLYTNDASMAAVTMDLKPLQEKGFFLRDNKWTCFRRNHFQLGLEVGFSTSGDMADLSSFSGDLYLKSANGEEIGINRFFTTVEAHGCLSRCPVKVYQSGSGDTDVAPIDFKAQSKKNHITFKRLQFNQSTPTNANRHYADPFFIIEIGIHCVGSDGRSRKLAECVSTNLVVLSGTPGQYKKDANKVEKKKKVKKQERAQSTSSINPSDLPMRCLTPHRTSQSIDFTSSAVPNGHMASNRAFPMGANLELNNLDIPLFFSNSTALSSATITPPSSSSMMNSPFASTTTPTPKPDLDAFFDEFVKGSISQQHPSAPPSDQSSIKQ